MNDFLQYPISNRAQRFVESAKILAEPYEEEIVRLKEECNKLQAAIERVEQTIADVREGVKHAEPGYTTAACTFVADLVGAALTGDQEDNDEQHGIRSARWLPHLNRRTEGSGGDWGIDEYDRCPY